MARPWKSTRARFALFAALAVALLFALPALAAAEPLSGTVTDEVTTDPIEGITVTAWQFDTQWIPIGSADTVANGSYSIDLPPGFYLIEFTDVTETYMWELYDDVRDPNFATLVNVPSSGSASGIDAALTPTPVAEPDPYEPDDLLGTGSSLTLGVLQEDRTLAPEADLDWIDLAVEAGQAYMVGTNGVADLPVCDTYLEVWDTDGLNIIAENDDRNMEYGDFFSEVVFVAPYTGTVRIKVRGYDDLTTGFYSIGADAVDYGEIAGTIIHDVTGGPLGGISAAALIEDQMVPGDWYWSGYSDLSDPEGAYSMILPSGTYRVYFDDEGGLYVPEYFNDVADVANATDIVVTGGATEVADASLAPAVLPEADAYEDDNDYTLANPLVIDGAQDHTLWPQGDVDWVSIEVAQGESYTLSTDFSGEHPMCDTVMSLWQADATTLIAENDDRAEGDYFSEIDFIAETDGTLYVKVVGYPYDQGDATGWYSLNFTGGAGDFGAIAGTVTGISPAGPVADCEVIVGRMVSDPEFGDYFNWEGSGVTDVNGDYIVEQLPTGDYNVFFGGTGDFLSEWWNNAAGSDWWSPPAEADTVTVSASETTFDIDAVLGAAGHITGRVTGPTGVGVNDGFVSAYKMVDGEWISNYAAALDADGTYDIGGLATGNYRVRFEGYDAGGRKYAVEFYNDKPVIELATDIAVVAGQTDANINAQLANSASFGGTVSFDDTGTPPPGAVRGSASPEEVRVELWLDTGASGWLLAESTYARIDTAYEYYREGLPAGNYKVKFVDELLGQYPPIFYNTKPSLALANAVAASGGQNKIVNQMLDSRGPEVSSDADASYTGNAEITITATDAGVGVASITYSLDGAAEITAVGTPVTVTVPEDGSHSLEFWATDKIGNVGSPETASFTVTGGSGFEVVQTQIAGAGRVDTAVKASQAAFPSGLDPAGAKTVVLATSMNWPDALGGTSLAGALDGPILLTDPNALPAVVAGEIGRLGADKAIILGGSGAVSNAVQASLNALLGANNVERIAGADRYVTANMIADRTIAVMGDAWDGHVLVATGGNFPDALAVAPLAASQGWPLVLCSPTTGLSQPTKVVMAKGSWIYVLGGEGAVSKAVMDSLLVTWGHQVERIAGADRYSTAVKIAQLGVDNCGLTWDKVALTTGLNFPDALAGGVLQGRAGSVMLLTPPTSVAPAVQTALTANKASISEVRFLGGVGAVSQSVRDAIALLLAQ